MNQRRKSGLVFARLVVVAMVASLVTVMTITASGAGTGSSDEPRSGGTLRYVQTVAPGGLDPTKRGQGAPYGQQGEVFAALFGMLVYQNAESEIVHSMARSLTTPDEGLTWVLKLRRNLEFTDGTPLDAAAVKANWDRIADPSNGSIALASFTSEVQSYEVTDARTLTIALTQQDATYPYFLALNASNFIGSPTGYEQLGNDFGTNPIGAGPFMLDESWTPGTPLEMVKNPDYFDAPRPYLDGLTIIFNGDSQQGLDLVETGQAESSFQSEKQKADQGEAAGLVPAVSHNLQGTGLLLNVTSAPLDDVSVREAFSLAVDLEQINASVYGYSGAPTNFFARSTAFATRSVKFPKRNLSAAQELIDEYRSTTGNDVEVTFSILADYPTQTQIAEIVQASLQELDGVTINIDPVAASVIGTQPQGTYQMAHTGGWVGFWPVIYQVYRSGLPTNVGGFDDPTLDQYLDEARSTTDRDEQIKAYQQATRQIVMEDYYYIPIVQSDFYWVNSPEVQGHVFFNGGGFLPDRIWLAAD